MTPEIEKLRAMKLEFERTQRDIPETMWPFASNFIQQVKRIDSEDDLIRLRPFIQESLIRIYAS